MAAAVLLCTACTARPPRFSVENAQAHVQMLAGDIGSRPTGTDANRRAREYIVGELRSYGFDVRVQETDAVRAQFGATVRVANIIATKPGRRGQAIALVSHYDSVPDGPGAADDGLGAAVCLEAGRVLAGREQPNYALALIFTDGEERGLMGAAAVMKHPIMGWVRAVLNLEAVGSGGPSLLFETDPGSGALLKAWAGAAPQPAGASYMVEIYKRLPNDTDFTLFRRARVPGLNFAAIGDSYSYHTARDTPARLDPALLRQTGENAVAVAGAIDEAADLSERNQAETIYFDILRTKAVAYGAGTALVLLAAAVLLSVFGWLTVLPVARQAAGILRMLLTAAWTLVGLAAAGGAMLGAAWLLRSTRETYQPWYAHPDRFFTFLALAGILGGWVVVRIGSLLPRGARGSTHPAVAWAITLPCWLALAVAAQFFAPSASYLAVIPLLAAGAMLVVSPIRHLAAIRIASAIVLAVAGTLWIPDAIVLLHLAVPVFGRLPIVTPLFVYPALLLFCGLFIVPPLLALIAHRDWRLFFSRGDRFFVVGFNGSALLVAALVFACAWCWFAPAYTDERPLQRQIRYVNDINASQSYWEMGGNEPAVDVARDAPIAGGWHPSPASPQIGTALDRLPEPFVFRAAASLTEAPPLRVTGSLNCNESDCSADITAVPNTGGLLAVFTLPAGVTPEETSLAGTLRRDTFRASYGALPAEGVTFHARLNRADREKMNAATVVAIANGVPGAAWPQLPSWLPQEHVVWHARSYFVIPVTFAASRPRP
jgi:hypothetical protein